VLSGQILAGCGEPAAPYLERIVAGEIASAAITDTKGAWSPAQVSCTFDGSTVSGSVRFVPYGASATFFVVAATTADGTDLFAVEASGAVVSPLRSLDFSRPSATVSFTSAPAVALTSGGAGSAAVDPGVVVALLAVGADQLGGTQQCFDMTLDYIKLRRQFNREIGSFQAVKHRVADALMLVEMSRSGIERVTSGASDDLSLDASVVKAWASDAYIAMTAETIQLHGGVGFTWEHDAHLFFRRARYDAAFLGDSTFHRERVAALLDW
jgi:alkylation response protein AidB-like acyl-CoA dehydrogenase